MWRCSTTSDGEQSVITVGISRLLTLCVVNLVTNTLLKLFKEARSLTVLGRCGSMMFVAMGASIICAIALTGHGEIILVHAVRMLS